MKYEKRKNKKEDGGGGSDWMTTYSDLVTLLLTFFVLLFSMATIETEKFKEVAFSLQSSFLHKSNADKFNEKEGEKLISFFPEDDSGKKDDATENVESITPAPAEEKFEQLLAQKAQEEMAKKLVEVRIDLEKTIEELQLKDYVTIIEEQHSLTLRISSVILFDSGKADVKDSGKEILGKLGNMLDEIENDILIQGHTDNVPINTEIFPTNWELSTKRATNVVIFLCDQCGLKPDKLTATGNGEFRPIAENDTPENREKNRRIDIVISKVSI